MFFLQPVNNLIQVQINHSLKVVVQLCEKTVQPQDDWSDGFQEIKERNDNFLSRKP